MKNYSLVFSGGGAKGAYEAGVWKAMKELHLDQRIRNVSGTSVGSLNGVLFTQGSFEQAMSIWQDIQMDQILTPENNMNIDKCELDDSTKAQLTNYVKNNMPSSVCKISWLCNFDKIFHKIMLPLYIKSMNDITLSVARRLVPLFLQIVKRLVIYHDIEGAVLITFHVITSLLKDGLFSQAGLQKIIDENLNVGLLQISNKKLCINAYNLSQLKKERFLVDKTNVSYVDKILLASSALPFIYDPVMINGNEYCDGGIPVVGDNVPIDTVYDKDDDIIVIVMSEDYKLPAKFDENRVHVVKPEVSLGGMFDGTLNFRENYTDKLLKLGYEDGLKQLSNLV